ncbi:hypothetical protein [Companilactobacillus kimchiensis]|uniref:Uncharacterized protein n=1 Tax=Companilactobacillus kimchiensis TaxID=993692 RepID=A0A0R2LDT3_9LACO|nr:hypothetical protein [Companilactobacillus kimchiensis]KRN96743.1 hypothetical protein IV57_GL001754 [Companilactobacillus kimchiensis]
MRTTIVKNDVQLAKALFSAEDNDLIKILPGIYFADKGFVSHSVTKNLTIEGLSNNAKDIHIKNFNLIIYPKITLILKNVTIDLATENINTIAMYDGSKLYGNNIVVNHLNPDHWDTIYCKDSFISLINSDIRTGDESNAPGLCLENSQLFADNTSIYFLVTHNSDCYIRDTVIFYSSNFDQHSTLHFNDLAIDSTNNEKYSDFYVTDNSTISGTNLAFSKNKPFIDVLNGSAFETSTFDNQNTIGWRFDDDSSVTVDGTEPFNQM